MSVAQIIAPATFRDLELVGGKQPAVAGQHTTLCSSTSTGLVQPNSTIEAAI